MRSVSRLDQVLETIQGGGVIAYPTEAVYGLGCDAFNQKAVVKLLKLKRRSVDKGLILIASHIQQVLPLIIPKHPNDLARALKTWPGHNTWVFPKSDMVPSWISGKHETIAIRISAHPIVKKICDSINQCLVSTSANFSKQENLNSIKAIEAKFNDKIQFYLDGDLGKDQLPSKIRDAHTNTVIR